MGVSHQWGAEVAASGRCSVDGGCLFAGRGCWQTVAEFVWSEEWEKKSLAVICGWDDAVYCDSLARRCMKGEVARVSTQAGMVAGKG